MQLRRSRPFSLLAVLAVFGLPWVLLFKTGAQARTQSARMDVAADVFLSQIPQQSQNDQANQFDRLAAQLGFVPNSADALVRVDMVAERDYRAIEGLLNEFLTSQLAKTTGPLEVLPAELNDYLIEYEVALAALQAHLQKRSMIQTPCRISPDSSSRAKACSDS